MSNEWPSLVTSFKYIHGGISKITILPLGVLGFPLQFSWFEAYILVAEDAVAGGSPGPQESQDSLYSPTLTLSLTHAQ